MHFGIKDLLNPTIIENNARVIKVKADIEETFLSLVEKLKDEKMQIFRMIEQIEIEK